MANLGSQAGSGLDASDITTGTLGNTVQDNITRLGTVTTGTMNNTIGSSATFPSKHIIQTVYSESSSYTQDSTAADEISASHLEDSITISSGNRVMYHFSFPNRMRAESNGWAGCQFLVYHQEGGSGGYTNAHSANNANWRGNLYYDESGNLPAGFYNDTIVNITGVHTPSSGTVHSYKLYYKFNSGNANTIGVANDHGMQYVILQEIKA